MSRTNQSRADKNFQEFCEGCKQQGVDPLTREAWEKHCKLVRAQIKAESPTLAELIEMYAESTVEASSDQEIAEEIIKSLKRACDEEAKTE